METRKKNNVATGAESAVVTLTLLAILVFSSVYVIAGSTANDKDSERHAYCRVVIPGTDGSMTTTEPLQSPNSMFITIPAVIGGQSVDDHRPIQKRIEFSHIRSSYDRPEWPVIAAVEISSMKAREFTLVGAKPSGTG